MLSLILISILLNRHQAEIIPTGVFLPRKVAYAFKMIRELSGMNRKDFSEWLGIPYRTMQEWELGRRVMPEYVLRLIAYKV